MVSRQPRRASQRGQSMVEFALIAVLLLSSIVMALDGARMVFVYSEMANGAAEGARQASLAYNLDSNLKPPACTASGTCDVPGVMPTIQRLARFGLALPSGSSCTQGLGVCYSLSPASGQPPWYGTYVNGDLQLSSSAQPNVLYVFVYYKSDAESAPAWPICDECSTLRGAGGEVVVDLKVRWVPLALSMLGASNPGFTFDAQSAATVE